MGRSGAGKTSLLRAVAGASASGSLRTRCAAACLSARFSRTAAVLS